MRIDVKMLRGCLLELADETWQRRAWLASRGVTVSSLSELASQTFDDTGLSDALDTGKLPGGWHEGLVTALRELDAAVSRVDQRKAPEQVLRDPKMRVVRELAARCLGLLPAEE